MQGERDMPGSKSRSAAVSCRTEVCYPFRWKYGRDRVVNRRSFITLLGGAAAWPLAADAQQAAKLPTIGFLETTTASGQNRWTAAFVQRLRELGWIDGRNIAS